ncbi:hypothetical protein [Hymenobacter psychrophilus]|uniref:Uncharacterized protein n=1 Tax=Hymenobacter psychrophilus TaxID=651662 RepID=A0A1H3G1D8_9BACT|nr:hypothetical protein [Hymenobacter psychrophilus]SDX96234.1 hypothetical protein SAMN04488069_104280 [Hymenobacter psychrophilus]
MQLRPKYLLVAAAVALLLWFVFDALTQPGPQDLDGGFTETALYRNENNTGPVQRIYAVTVADTARWAEMQQYGEYMPYTKYGNTKVYFFSAARQAPRVLQPGSEPFAAEFRTNCLAVYEKDLLSNVSFKRRPFGQR